MMIVDSDDDVPLISFKRPSQKPGNSSKAHNGTLEDNSHKSVMNSDDEDDKPLSAAFKCNGKETSNKRRKSLEGDVPVSEKKKAKSSSDTLSSSGVTVGSCNGDGVESNSAANGNSDGLQVEDSDDDDMPLIHSFSNSKQKRPNSAKKEPQVSDSSNSDTSTSESQGGVETEAKLLVTEAKHGNEDKSKRKNLRAKEEDDGDSDDSDNLPLGHQFRLKRKKISSPKQIRQSAVAPVKVEEGEDDDDDIPLGKILCTEKRKNLNMKQRQTSMKTVVKDEDISMGADDVCKQQSNASKTPARSRSVSTKNQKPLVKEEDISEESTSGSESESESDSDSEPESESQSEEDDEEEEEEEEDDDDDDDDIPLGEMLKKQRLTKASGGKDASEIDEDSDDDVTLVRKNHSKSNARNVNAKSTKVNAKIVKKSEKRKTQKSSDDDVSVNSDNSDDDDYQTPSSKKKKTATPRKSKAVAKKKAASKTEQKKEKKERKKDKSVPGAGGGKKWTTLEHHGVIFPPPYSSHGVKMLYDGKPVDLTLEQEEVATFFAVMRDTDYASKPTFLANFWHDWKKILGPNHVIQEFERCDFTPIYDWHLAEKEKKKQISNEDKKAAKEERMKLEDKYTWAIVDGVKEKVGNFRVEPPGLFRGRGEHPKMGKVKRRIYPEDIVINIGADAPVPECPMPGRRWKEIRHDNSVTWLAYWNDPINPKEQKYVFLAASSNLKGQSDKEKYEKARVLKNYIEDIRKTYTANFTSSDVTARQIAVATYLIDRLALRAGNEKDDDEADTVGCCSLKVEHVTLVPPKSLQFDFLGKDSIRYFNVVEVVEPVYKAIGDFKKDKVEGQDLFDKLDTSKLNAHLKNIMPGLTAKVFRTYNASITLDTLLVDTEGQLVVEKIAAYQRANKEVAILCNHQRSVPKAHGAQMEKLEAKLGELNEILEELEKDLERAKKGKSPGKDKEGNPKKTQNPEVLEKKIRQTKQKMDKMKLDMNIKEDLKTVALGTSKINYMDPRITVAWCKHHEVPIEKVFNKSLLAKFAWAMEVEIAYRF